MGAPYLGASMAYRTHSCCKAPEATSMSKIDKISILIYWVSKSFPSSVAKVDLGATK